MKFFAVLLLLVCICSGFLAYREYGMIKEERLVEPQLVQGEKVPADQKGVQCLAEVNTAAEAVGFLLRNNSGNQEIESSELLEQLLKKNLLTKYSGRIAFKARGDTFFLDHLYITEKSFAKVEITNGLVYPASIVE